MSEATKSMALSHAIALHGKSGATPEDIIETAGTFHAFIAGADTPTKPAKPVKAATPATPTKPAKPVKAAPPADEDEDETEVDDEPDMEEDEDVITKEHVGEALAALIDNDQKDDAIAILKKHGAKSLSSLESKHYQKVKALADKKLTVV